MWWLILDIVWLYVFYIGIGKIHGPWNPLTLQGSTFFCHVAFHADSTLALARTLFLYTLYTRGREGKALEQPRERAAVEGGSGSAVKPVARASSAAKRR